MIKRIMDGATLIAIVGSFQDVAYGNNFITSPELPMQIGVLRTKPAETVQNHIHKIRNRQTKSISNEFHMIVHGKAFVSLFNSAKNLVAKELLVPGMFCALFNGGHGYEFLKDDTIMLEVKTGPYSSAEDDKEKF